MSTEAKIGGFLSPHSSSQTDLEAQVSANGSLPATSVQNGSPGSKDSEAEVSQRSPKGQLLREEFENSFRQELAGMASARPQNAAVYKNAEAQYLSSVPSSPVPDHLLENVLGTITYFQPGYVTRLEKQFPVNRMTDGDSAYREMENEWSSHCIEAGRAEQAPSHRWIHIPANNTLWLEQVMFQILEFYYRGNRGDAWPQKRKEGIFHPDYWSGQQNRASTRMYSRFMNPFGTAACKDGKTGSEKKLLRDPSTLALYFPFLHWERSIAATYMNHVAKNVGAKKYRAESQGVRLEELVGSHGPTDEYLLRRYLRSKSPVHMRRTLDQFYQVDLDKTRDRDIDQTISRYFETHFEKEGRKLGSTKNREPPILMVDQCWFWMIGTDTILTSWPSSWGSFDGLSDPLDVRTRIMAAIGKPAKRQKARSARACAQYILEACLGNIIEYSALTDDEKLINRLEGRWKFFEQYTLSLNQLVARQADYFKIFDQNVGTESQGEINDLFVSLDEFKDFREAKDISDELNMIMKVVDDQLEALTMLANRSKMSNLQGVDEDLKKMSEDLLVRRHMKRKFKVAALIKRADSVVSDITRFIDLKQQRASISEARSLRRMAQEGEKQSATQMLFTVITIIFLPLQTLTSFFSVNAVELNGGVMRIGIVLAYTLPISAAIIVFALFLGFNHSAREYFAATTGSWFEWLLLRTRIRRGALAERTTKRVDKILQIQKERELPHILRTSSKPGQPPVATPEKRTIGYDTDQSDPESLAESVQYWSDEDSETLLDESEPES